jgi:predicted ATP-grasp superfamily ATP-dependent carboligase
MGLRLFEGIGWQGIGNVEFKRDERDGQLKLIEVNGRFTAAQRLITEAGAPIDVAIYCHLTGQHVPRFEPQTLPRLCMWYPLRDTLAYLEMKRSGQITFAEWLGSLRGERKVFPYFDLRDPAPWLEDLLSDISRVVAAPIGVIRKVFGIARLSPNGDSPMAPSSGGAADLD